MSSAWPLETVPLSAASETNASVLLVRCRRARLRFARSHRSASAEVAGLGGGGCCGSCALPSGEAVSVVGASTAAVGAAVAVDSSLRGAERTPKTALGSSMSSPSMEKAECVSLAGRTPSVALGGAGCSLVGLGAGLVAGEEAAGARLGGTAAAETGAGAAARLAVGREELPAPARTGLAGLLRAAGQLSAAAAAAGGWLARLGPRRAWMGLVRKTSHCKASPTDALGSAEAGTIGGRFACSEGSERRLASDFDSGRDAAPEVEGEAVVGEAESSSVGGGRHDEFNMRFIQPLMSVHHPHRKMLV